MVIGNWVIYLLSPQSPVTSNQSPVTNPQSPVTSPQKLASGCESCHNYN
ncbi:hypothetical protein H5968_10600 [Sphaerospermopsis sp. LEGE 00249]|nr:hypothetical protein [Sphaerospermopsis sp. LEGE 00249]MBC5795585.1 hypothetical protein [Sphaerospermopsis sp. LEGE 00249]